MMDEKLIDILWEVKEGKKHPNKAFKEILKLSNEDAEKRLIELFRTQNKP